MKTHTCPKHGEEECNKWLLLAKLLGTTKSHNCTHGIAKYIPLLPPYWTEK